MKKLKILTYGCQMNVADSERMAGLLKEIGYTLTDDFDEADLLLINTCCVRETAEDKAFGKIGELKRLKVKKPSLIFGVTGCMAQKEGENLIKRAPHLDFVLGTGQINEIAKVVEGIETLHGQVVDVSNVGGKINIEKISPIRAGQVSTFVPIMYGCDNFCTYCIVPHVRGRVRSRSLESIRAECLQLAAAGFKEIVLTGIHIGAYGRDFKNSTTLADAVKKVLDTANPVRLRLGSVESAEMTDELIELMKNDPRICNHVHLPLQSGSDEILKAMRRPYTTKNFAGLVEKLVKEIPEISIGTDLIVGFPGETEKHFDETTNFLQSLPLSKIHVFPFSSRPGTVAAGMKNQIDSATKKFRTERVLEIAGAKEKIFAEKFIGRTVEIISETEEDGIFDGLTKNYVRVFVPASPEIKSGEIIKVRVEKLFRNGIFGELVK